MSTIAQSQKPTLRPFTVPDFFRAKKVGEKIVVLTAYDYPTAKLVDESGVDAILVGDSLGMVVQGKDTPLEVTLDEMIYHSRMVARAVRRSFLVTDLPFMTYQISPEQALANAGRLVQEGGAHAVKLEGGETVAPMIRKITNAGIPVMGHIGMTPQSVRKFGGFRVQRDEDAILNDAIAVAQAGAFAVVLECIPKQLAQRITEHLEIPTIGIGAGPDCDGQVLVLHDMLGMFDKFTPKFVKKYVQLGQVIQEGVEAYVDEVRSKQFPTDSHGFD